MKKELAVEWLVNQISEKMGIRIDVSSIGESLLKQAKEIEMQGKRESYNNGYANGQNDAYAN